MQKYMQEMNLETTTPSQRKAMGRTAVYSVISKCFAPVEQDLWDELTSFVYWKEFLDDCRVALRDDEGEGRDGARNSQDRSCPLQDFLSAGEVNALFNPPTFDKKRRFAALHFTGGLPISALPVESLYRYQKPALENESFLTKQKGCYLGESAHYMQFLIEHLGMQLPCEYQAYPDHLSLELDLLAIMERSGFSVEAKVFLVERFRWLPRYRARLLQVTDDARFYVGLIDVLIGLYSNQIAIDEEF